MPDFSKRSAAIEIMDDLSCSGEVVHQTLRELETINYLLGGNYVTITGIQQLLQKPFTGSVEVTDLGCGSGDILRLIGRWSNKKSLDLQLTGLDANPFVIAFARSHPEHIRHHYRNFIFSPLHKPAAYRFFQPAETSGEDWNGHQ
jgi:hypothetical protein